jgi:hypothetical protein
LGDYYTPKNSSGPLKKWPNSKISPNLVNPLQSEDSQNNKYATFVFQKPSNIFFSDLTLLTFTLDRLIKEHFKEEAKPDAGTGPDLASKL